MKTKLTLLAAIVISAIGSSLAIAGRDSNTASSAPKTSAPAKPAAMGCCAMGAMNHGTDGTDCHAAKDTAPAKPKSCCK